MSLRCNFCGGRVTKDRRRGPHAINDDTTAEYHVECRNCGESAHVLLMAGVGWEPVSFVDLEGSV